jgi:predicted dehydrogenase
VRQAAQHPRSGEIVVVDTPAPALKPGWVLVANRFSLLSAGTERTKLDFGKKSLLGKARSRPDLVRTTLERVRVDGVRSTLALARDRLDALAPLGYSCAGVVLRVGSAVEGLAPGDPVACGGAGWANHAEVVAVPCNLVARVPDDIELDDACYATVGAIALHAVRQSEARIGERVGVVGLGLVGQLVARILAAAGCEIFGVDVDPAACALARDAGATAFTGDSSTLEPAVRALTDGIGLDAVLVCAASSSSEPLELAIRLARDRGRVVMVGDVPVAADRRLLYEKELELRLSRSYGPGRYDRDYEERGRDLPPGYVRWTERRNLQAFLELVAAGRVDPSPLTSHRFPVERAGEAYAVLAGKGDGARAFGVLLEYEAPARPAGHVTAAPSPASGTRIGVLGAGSFARGTLLPQLRKLGADLAVVATEGGLSAADTAARYGFERQATAEEILADDSIGAVVVATRHGSHAAIASAALRAGKAVFVEKPLALTEAELLDVEAALRESGRPLMVGFNRRFAPLVARLSEELGSTPGRILAARVNAGPLPSDHWLHDPEEGGGRLLGVGCHFVDLLIHLAGAAPISAHAVAVPVPDRPLACSDDVAATLRFADGSVASLLYTGSGDPRLPKERLEAFGGNLAAVLDDFRRLELYRGGRRTIVKGRRDKGHRLELARFLAVLAGRAEPPSTASYLTSTRATLALAESLRTGSPVELA